MQKIVSIILFWLGVTLWIPGFALFNVGGAWGLQTALLLGLVLFILMVFIMSVGHEFLQRRNYKWEWLLFYSVAFLSDLACTIFTHIDRGKSIQTFGTEMFGLTLGLTVAWWICRLRPYSESLLQGFRRGGMFAAVYAIYQVVGWRFGLPLTALPLNNASFSNIDPVAARVYGRALAACPEPSVLASLLLPLLAIMTVDVFLYGGVRRYGWWIVTCMAFLATSSQSLLLIPVCLIGVILFCSLLLPKRRLLRQSDLIGLAILAGGIVVLLSSSDTVLLWLSRIGGGTNVSAHMRLAEVAIALSKFQQSPIFGFGLGSSGFENDKFVAQLELIAASQGITSGIFRILSEQGLTGLGVIITAAVCLTFSWKKRAMNLEQAALLAYQFSFVFATILACLFVGYRNLYHLWLIMPVGLCLKSEWKTLRPAREAAPARKPFRRLGTVGMEGEAS